MGKVYWIVGTTALVIVAVLLVIFYNGNNSPKNFVDDSLISKYPALKTSEFNRNITGNENAEMVFINGSLKVDGKELSYEGDKKYYCNNKIVDAKLYYSHVGSNSIGDSYSVYVIDCKDYYWISYAGSLAPEIYGPFV